MRILQAAGYHVTRAVGSFGMFDVIAINAQGVRLIQLKSHRDASPQEREAIQLFGGLPVNTTKEVWILMVMCGSRSSRRLGKHDAQ
jgi:Archaeal holliday junction resolvase (hjc)